jgi:large-conductance mechanosensitive channel
MDILGQGLTHTTNTVGNFSNDFRKYSNNNNLVVVAAAVCIGIATKDIIEKLMNEAVLPIMKVMVKNSLYFFVYKLLLKTSVSKPTIVYILKTIGTVGWLFFMWSVIVFVSFVLFKKLLDKNLVANQLNFLHKIGGYAVTLEESIKNQFRGEPKTYDEGLRA